MTTNTPNNTRLCPVTGEPLPLTDPGRIISQTACNRLRTATSNLADIMAVIQQMIAGARRKGGSSKPTFGSRPPLNDGLLSVIDDLRDTIDIWANNLIVEARPSFRYTPGNWPQAQAIFQQYADLCGHWTHGKSEPGFLCVDRVVAAVERLERIAFPPDPQPLELTDLQRIEAKERLEDMSLTIGPACEAIRLLTGTPLPASTVRSWKHRGRITSIGEPPRYHVGDLLELLQHS